MERTVPLTLVLFYSPFPNRFSAESVACGFQQTASMTDENVFMREEYYHCTSARVESFLRLETFNGEAVQVMYLRPR